MSLAQFVDVPDTPTEQQPATTPVQAEIVDGLSMQLVPATPSESNVDSTDNCGKSTDSATDEPATQQPKSWNWVLEMHVHASEFVMQGVPCVVPLPVMSVAGNLESTFIPTYAILADDPGRASLPYQWPRARHLTDLARWNWAYHCRYKIHILLRLFCTWMIVYIRVYIVK